MKVFINGGFLFRCNILFLWFWVIFIWDYFWVIVSIVWVIFFVIGSIYRKILCIVIIIVWFILFLVFFCMWWVFRNCFFYDLSYILICRFCGINSCSIGYVGFCCLIILYCFYIVRFIRIIFINIVDKFGLWLKIFENFEIFVYKFLFIDCLGIKGG